MEMLVLLMRLPLAMSHLNRFSLLSVLVRSFSVSLFQSPCFSLSVPVALFVPFTPFSLTHTLLGAHVVICRLLNGFAGQLAKETGTLSLGPSYREEKPLCN